MHVQVFVTGWLDPHCKVITQTSEYELTQKEGNYILTKTKLINGVSAVPVGRNFTGKQVWLNDYGCLCIGDMHTRPVKNRDEVIKFLADNA